MYKLKNIAYILIIFVSIFIFDSIAYAYKTYSIGDVVAYNDIEFYVIKDSSSEEDTLILLKAEPLTVEEVNLYGGVGTDDNHVNNYNESLKHYTAYDINGYGGMMFYSKVFQCGYSYNHPVFSGCKTDYEISNVKYVVDNWGEEKVKTGYKKLRLATISEISSMGYEFYDNGSIVQWIKSENTPDWIYSEEYGYWLQSPYNDSDELMYVVGGGYISSSSVINHTPVVRPVVELHKCAIDSSCNSDQKSEVFIDDDSKVNIQKDNVKVPNTLQKISIIFIMIGIILVSVSVVIVINNRK